MAHQNPHPSPSSRPLRPTQTTILSGLDTASYYLSKSITRWHLAHPKKYSDSSLLKLQELDEEVEEMLEIRHFRTSRKIQGMPGDFGTRILCILAQLNVMKDYMDEVDRMEKGWVWVDEANQIPLGDVNGQRDDRVKEREAGEEVECDAGQKSDAFDQIEEIESGEGEEDQKPGAVAKTGTITETGAIKSDAKAADRDQVIGGKYLLIDENGNEEEVESVNGRKSMDSEFSYIQTDGEDGGMEAVNGTNPGEQGLLTTLQKYLRALKVR